MLSSQLAWVLITLVGNKTHTTPHHNMSEPITTTTVSYSVKINFPGSTAQSVWISQETLDGCIDYISDYTKRADGIRIENTNEWELTNNNGDKWKVTFDIVKRYETITRSEDITKF